MKEGLVYFVAGGAGFIGQATVHKILRELSNVRVIVYDNFTSGKMEHLQDILDDPRLEVIRGEISNEELLDKSMQGVDIVFHYASNPDIAKAITEPEIDFWQGTFLTQCILESMRRNDVHKIVYASGSGVYGDLGETEAKEDYGPKMPVSTYGASKLAGESLICSYCYMFNMVALVFRFANVVGDRQTHGVGYDFIRKLKEDPTKIDIFGDGTQSKSYIYVEDVLDAISLAMDKDANKVGCYNISSDSYVTVEEIADIVVEEMGLIGVKYSFSGGNIGWKGDVNKIRFNIDRIKSLGWYPKHTSKEAIRKSIKEMLRWRQ